MQALGLQSSSQDLQAAISSRSTPKTSKRKLAPPSGERRGSDRNKGAVVNYKEDDIDTFFGTERYGFWAAHELPCQ